MVPRGIRNNNPLNIRISGNRWRGKITPSADAAFEQFTNMTLGIRAAMVCVRTYMKKYHLTTPQQIIARWAPEPDQNDVKAYIANACRKANLLPTVPIKFSEKNKVCRLLWGMAFVECGQTISFQLFENAYEAV